MSARRASGRRQATSYKDPRRRIEIAKAVGAASGVVLLTALIIFVIQPDDGTTQTPTPTPIQTTPQSLPTGATGATGLPTGATGATGTTGTSTPADTTATSTPATSSTPPPQP